MYFADAESTSETGTSVGLAGITLAVCTAAVVLLGIFPSLLNGILGAW
jgi:hypothetical protein